MKISSKQTIAVGAMAAIACAATTSHAQVRKDLRPTTLQGSLFSTMSFTKPQPLGLVGVQSTPAGSYDRAATAKALANRPSANASTKALATLGNVLVLYDSTGTYGWLGDLYSQQMVTLLTHFNVTSTRLPVEKYTAGQMNASRATFYLGLLYNNPLPAAFKADVMTTTQPLCWMGYNIWQVAWNADNSWNTSFVNKFGMTFYYIDSLGYPTVSYKGQNLTKLQYDTTEGRMEITDATMATRVASSTRTDGLNIGYITKGSNLYYVADNPFSYTTYTTHNDRVLAFEDTIHDIINDGAVTDHRAVIRVEDVSPIVPAATLRTIADTMFAQGVPFVVSVIPSFQDPLGSETGKAQSQDMTKNAAFVSALKYMQSKGGQILMHGYTHQYGKVANPYNGESADDFEFFRVITTSTGAQSYVGPVPEDTSAWAANRLTTGMNLLKTSGFTAVKGWVTPHYMASPVDYVEIKKQFAFSLCRALTFSQNSAGALQYVQQHCPWVYTDTFGMKHIPETIGYMDTDVYQGIPPNLPANLISYAQANSVVRDGWAGMYYHWYLDPALLTQLITGVKGLGYRFVNPDSTTL